MLKFSIIVPVYNCENYLEGCIDSVLKQTFENYELILVDDGSTDRSGRICDDYSLRYSETIIAKHNQNQGPYLARLQGIDAATGDVIVFLDSDDCLRKDALELLNEYFLRHDCDMVIYNAQECDEFPSKEIIHPFDDGIIFEGEGKKILYRSLVETRILNSICLKAVKRKNARLPNGISTKCRLKHGEDLLLSAGFITSSQRIVYMKEGIYHYRITPGSITHSYSKELNISLKTVHEIFDDIINLWDMPELTKTHNARKVSGWVDILIIIQRARHELTKDEILGLLKNMVSDPYFITAYENMDKEYLSLYYRSLAFCMYKKYYPVLITLGETRLIVSKLKKLYRR